MREAFMEEPSEMPIPPLGIDLDVRPGVYRVLTSVAALGDVLMERWPEKQRGRAWRSAVVACLRALETQTDAEVARSAFIMAAKDAGISVNANAEHFEPRKRETSKKKPQTNQ
ncbi:hypothetical protein BN77_p11019 [Rhizobium mesoamericanum STM3625]|uniref:DUF982 domain-containing protein n=2 Tax=Rhizobium mesoamericanum TaxID=1079800 RepID=K0Q2E3_9HYPH|nr:hypothetical protein BN77_p11019 [Rhizobium mesoamericanum STM3625]